jgi:hypothetical protein
MVLIGAFVGVGGGVASGRYIATLLYEVKSTDARIVAIPALAISILALLAALPAVIRAVRIDPAVTLRVE